MNQIHYFRNESTFVAIAPAQFCETITHYHSADQRYPLFSSLSLSTGKHHKVEFYERIENGYQQSTYQEYISARRAVQNSLAEFFGEFEQFKTPPVALNYKELDPDLMQGFLVQVSK